MRRVLLRARFEVGFRLIEGQVVAVVESHVDKRAVQAHRVEIGVDGGRCGRHWRIARYPEHHALAVLVGLAFFVQ